MKTVVVTGATGGIGRAVCAAFAREGASVVASARDSRQVESAKASFSGADIDIDWVVADVRDEYDIERLMESAARNGGVDVVIPCAAVNHDSGSDPRIADTSYAAFDDTFRTNARGIFTTIREAIPHLNDGARVLIPTCDYNDTPRDVYDISKTTATAIAKGFADEISAAVAVVDPGVIATELTGDQGRDPSDAAALFVEAADRSPDSIDGTRIDHRSTRP